MHAKPLTDLTCKGTPERLCLSHEANTAFKNLKDLLCRVTMEPLFIIDVSKHLVYTLIVAIIPLVES